LSLTEDEYKKPILGMPKAWLGFRRDGDSDGVPPTVFHIGRMVHPLRWLKWRLQVHRSGALAPRYEDFGNPEG
jgi:hypothetical protein